MVTPALFRLAPPLLGLFLLGTKLPAAPLNPIMPAPAALQFTEGRLPVTATFTTAIHGHDDPRLRAGLARALLRAEARTGLTLPHTPAGEFVLTPEPASASLVIECAAPGEAIPVLGEDESYTLEVSPAQAVLRAPTVLGALHGLETLLQLLQSDATGWFVPAVTIQDRPRFPWRGLMIDVCRHWQPIEVIKRNLDGMALVKLNVLHLHLTEDQGFRIESKTFPRLHELGSDGHYFTQDQIRAIIAYAAARGIRVVPEFDVPGHATSWVTAYPELASAPGPYSLQRKWGVFDPVLDPTNPKVYELLDGFLGEMAALFPDAYIHIGGDENNGVQWNANPQIRTFIREHQLKDNASLHAYFNGKLHAILAKYGKQLIGWDEILHPDLPAGSVVHSWRGPDGIAAATKLGFATILSNGYYIDLNYRTTTHYLNDPVPADTSLTPEQQKLVLGGEATMWSEWVTPETIDSRIWPRTAAIAERLWSAREVNDVPDMYRRLAFVSRRLEEAGLQHESYLEPALRRLAGDTATPAELQDLRTLVNLLEPVKHYERNDQQPGVTQFSPLTGLVDCTRADSSAARDFSTQVYALVHQPLPDARAANEIMQTLIAWQFTAEHLTGLAAQSPRLHEAAPMLQSLANASALGREALAVILSGHVPPAGWLNAQAVRLDAIAQPHAATELPVIIPLKLLVTVAAEQDKRAKLTPEAWKQHLLDLMFPATKTEKSP